MIDILGQFLLLVGAILSALAAWGILDFPTPLARMHAATKPASLGLASMVLGAGLLTDSYGLTALGALVAVGLFLTTPISGHLLGRAAYLAGQAPELVHDDLAGTTPSPGLTQTRRSFAWWRVAVLTVSWLVLWQDFALGTAVAGLLVAVGVELAVAGWAGERSRISVLGSLLFAVRYVGLVVRSTARVAWEVVTPRNEKVREAIVRVPLRTRSESAAVLLANAITYTPGTLTIDLAEGCLFVHVLHFEDVETTIADVRRVEELVLAAIPGPIDA